MKCSKCGLENSDDSRFCQNCGAEIISSVKADNTPAQRIENNYDYSVLYPNLKNSQNEKVKSKRFKTLLIVIIAVTLSIAILLTTLFLKPFSLFKKSETKPTAPIVYTTENELFVLEEIGEDAKSSETIKISTNYGGTYLFSENYKYIVYAENVEYNTDVYGEYEYNGGDVKAKFDLYYKDLQNKESNGVLIAKNVSSLDLVLGDIDKIIYGKNDDIYSFTFEEENKKLAKDATFYGLKKGKKSALCYQYIEGEDHYSGESDDPDTYNLKYVDLKSGAVTKICDSVSSFCCNSDCDNVYYIKDERLYVFRNGDEKKHIANDITNCCVVNETPYYYRLDKEFTYYDFVKDDYANTDDSVQKPDWENYRPDYSDYEETVYDEYYGYYTRTDYPAYSRAYQNADARYNRDYTNYENAQSRISIRQELYADSGFSSYSLYTFDGKNSIKISDNVKTDSFTNIQNITSVGNAQNDSISVCADVYKTPLQKIKKLNITLLSDSDEVKAHLKNNTDSRTIIATDTGKIDIDSKKNNLSFSDVYYFGDQYLIFYKDTKSKDNNSTSIYTLKTTAKSMKEAKLLKEKIYGITYLNNKLVSFGEQNKKYESATVLFDKQKIDDVHATLIMQKGKKNAFYYSTDYDGKNNSSTVYYYSKGKSTKIADDIMFSSDSFAEKDGKYIAIADYDKDDLEGTLVCINGKKKFQIDTNVKRIESAEIKQLYCVTP